MNDAPAPENGVVVVTFALPDESRDFTASLTGRVTARGNLPLVIGTLDGRPVVVVHTGVGDETGGRQRLRAGWEAVARLNNGQPPAWAISAGYAGALHLDLRVGDLVFGANRSSTTLLERARTLLAADHSRSGTLHTQTVVAETAAAKAALYAETGALAVDMETAWIAAECAEAGVPLLSLRVISDAADLSFPVPGRILFDAVRQRPRYVALPLWLLTHPTSIAPFASFVRNLPRAKKKLSDALQGLLS